LIEQEYQRKPASGLMPPVIELTFAGLVDIIAKLFLALEIEHGVLTEPGVHSPVDLWC
jgi:hypothetical protein